MYDGISRAHFAACYIIDLIAMHRSLSAGNDWGHQSLRSGQFSVMRFSAACNTGKGLYIGMLCVLDRPSGYSVLITSGPDVASASEIEFIFTCPG